MSFSIYHLSFVILARIENDKRKMLRPLATADLQRRLAQLARITTAASTDAILNDAKAVRSRLRLISDSQVRADSREPPVSQNREIRPLQSIQTRIGSPGKRSNTVSAAIEAGKRAYQKEKQEIDESARLERQHERDLIEAGKKAYEKEKRKSELLE
jgi:hypothetical protein